MPVLTGYPIAVEHRSISPKMESPLALTVELSEAECAALRDAILEYRAQHPDKAEILRRVYFAAEGNSGGSMPSLLDDLEAEAGLIATAVVGLGDRHATLLARSRS